MKVLALLLAVLAATGTMDAKDIPRPEDKALPDKKTTCRPTKASEIILMPAFQDVRRYMLEKNPGELKAYHTNLEGLTDFPATICTEGGKAVHQPLQPQSCTKADTVTSDTGGAEGKLVAEVSTGYKSSASVTDTSTLMLGAGLGVSLSTNFLVAGMDTAVDATFEYTRETGSTATEETDSSVSSQREVYVKGGRQCSITTTTQACKYVSKGSYPVVMAGWIVFEYKKKVNGKRFWAFPLSAVREEGREKRINFEIALDTKTDVDVTAKCANGKTFPVNSQAATPVPTNTKRSLRLARRSDDADEDNDRQPQRAQVPSTAGTSPALAPETSPAVAPGTNPAVIVGTFDGQTQNNKDVSNPSFGKSISDIFGGAKRRIGSWFRSAKKKATNADVVVVDISGFTSKYSSFGL